MIFLSMCYLLKKLNIDLAIKPKTKQGALVGVFVSALFIITLLVLHSYIALISLILLYGFISILICLNLYCLYKNLKEYQQFQSC